MGLRSNWHGAALGVLALCACGPGGAGEADAGVVPVADPPAALHHGLTEAQARQVVVRVGDSRVRLGELATLLGPRPLRRRLPPEPKRRAKFLEELVRTELLFAEAHERGLDADGPATRVRREAMVGRLVEDLTRQHGAREQDVTDAELREYYEANPERFTLPERVRAAHILVATVAQARALRSRLEQASSPAALFAQLARSESLDARTAHSGGDLGWITRKAPATQEPPEAERATGTAPAGDADATSSASLQAPVVPDAVRSAVFALREPGALAIVESELGHHLLRYVDRRAPSKTPLAQIARVLRGQLAEERREQALQGLVEELAGARGLTLHEERLEQVRW